MDEEREEDRGQREPKRRFESEQAQERLRHTGEERCVQREPHDAELGRDRERRGVGDEEGRRAAVGGKSLACAWLRAKAHADEGVLGEDARCQLDPSRAVARDTLGRRARDLVGHEGASADDDEHRRDGRRESDGTVARDHRDEHRDAEERHQARLRVGEEEAREQERHDDCRDRQPGLSVPRHGEHNRDPEHEVTAVQARVAEERRYAEEARVRIADLDGGRVEEQPVGGLLDDADCREEGCERHGGDPQGARHPGRERRSRHDGHEDDEWEEEVLEEICRSRVG